MENLTPMLQQYHSIKAKHKDCILLFRLGDFYEMFYDDAQAVFRVLDLVLTSRGKTSGSRIPMCGFPYHAASNYISRLIKSGHKVAICEQLEDPSLAKGIVKRDIIRIVSAGTYLDENSSESRYLMCLSPNGEKVGIALTDPTMGTIQTNQYNFEPQRLIEVMARLPICECVFPQNAEEKIKNLFQNPLLKLRPITLTTHEDWCFNPEIAKKSLCEHFKLHNLHGFGIEDLTLAISSAGALLEYLKHMNKQPLRHIDKITLYTDDDYVFISPAAHRGLEMDSLIKTLDHTVTPLGKRRFSFWITHPLKDISQIHQRQQAILILKENSQIQQHLQNALNRIPDIEKNISRLSCGYTHAKDLLAIRNTLCLIPTLRDILRPLEGKSSFFKLDDVLELRRLLEDAINEDVSLSHPEGKIIKRGYHPELDSLRDLQETGQTWLKKFQVEEIKRTGINSLKVGFNNIFGYYIEITKTNLEHAPSDYIRKQTLVNAERFITPQLKEYEEKILTAQEKIIKIENEIVEQLKNKILDASLSLHHFCETISTIDCLYALSVLASSPGYVLPAVTDDTTIDIKDGRHPVVEKTLKDSFVPNDTLLDNHTQHLVILTGPNMAGKSTYIRQTALLVLLAQTGSFVPAQSARVGIVDKIFTRIGAHDDITKGQSTFMVEMNETADILNNLTPRSLIILDEIGRGTSTYDGLSLAWALAEHLQKTKVRTLFATHFHELTALAQEFEGIKNYNVAVKKWKEEIVFLHKIVPGSTDDSYGIYVAKLAGIPSSVIGRAKDILTQLELKNNLKENLSEEKIQPCSLTLISDEIKATLDALNVNNLTPLQALNTIQELKNKYASSQNSTSRDRQ